MQYLQVGKIFHENNILFINKLDKFSQIMNITQYFTKTKIQTEDTSDTLISNNYEIKCVLLGNQGVGKSTLGHIFGKEKLSTDITSTIGAGYIAKTVNLKNYKNQSVFVNVWDTAGSERFLSFTKSYMRNVDIAFLVYDVTDPQSFKSLDTWKFFLDEFNEFNNIPYIVIIGCKKDLHNTITERDLNKKCEEWNTDSYLISSIEWDSIIYINNLFTEVIEKYHQLLLDKINNNEMVPDHVLQEYENIKLKNLIDVKDVKCCNR